MDYAEFGKFQTGKQIGKPNPMRLATALATAVSILAICLFCMSAHAQNEAKLLQAEFDTKVKPILQSHCLDCHAGLEASAGLNLDSYQTLEQVLDADRKWMSISKQIAAGTMPPDDSSTLTRQEKEVLLSWIENVFEMVNCDNSFPGNVTIRKLNRTEYRNSVRDLLGVDYQPAKNFPGDDVGHGFDNVADVLPLPPLLREKYLDAAETISQLAIVDPTSVNISLGASSFKPAGNNSSVNGEGLSLLSEDTASKKINFQLPGVYAFVVKAFGDSANNEHAKMSVLANDKLIKTVDVKAQRRKPAWYGFELEIEQAGENELQIRFENDYYKPRRIGSEDRNLHLISVVIRGPRPPKSEIGYLNFESKNDAEAGKFIEAFLPRVFRTQLSQNRIRRFQKLYAQTRNDGESFHGALRTVIQTALVSPQFLYKLEQPVKENSIRSLSDFERATALSYFLWSSTPDDELLDLARQNKLHDAAIWKQQVGRLFDHSKSNALIDNFVSQWLNLKLLTDIEPDPDTFAGIDRQLLLDMKRETAMVMSDIFRRDASLMEVLDCDFTYLNETLADHYQLPDVTGDDFQRVALANTNRGGILTHASFLTLTSNPTRTSPVKRGRWIMENILGLEPPPALPDVVPLDDQRKLTGTLRERMQQHREDPACASCHATMDALGFALENFDGVGRFRLQDDGFDIDAISKLPDGIELNGSQGLQQQITTTYKDQFVRCFTEKLLTYAIGRGIKYFDRCAVDKIIQRAAKADYRISAFILGVADSDPFLKRGSKTNRLFE